MCCLPVNQHSESDKELNNIFGKLVAVGSRPNGDCYIILYKGNLEEQGVNLSPTMISDDPINFLRDNKDKTVRKVFCSFCSVSFWTMTFPSPSPKELFICCPCKIRKRIQADEFPYSAM